MTDAASPPFAPAAAIEIRVERTAQLFHTLDPFPFREKEASTFGWILQQSVVILGWVANWRPLEIFLYDWWPLARRRDLYLRLAAARVELQPY